MVVVAQAVKGAEMKQWPRVRVHGTEIGTPGTALAPVTKIGFARGWKAHFRCPVTGTRQPKSCVSERRLNIYYCPVWLLRLLVLEMGLCGDLLH